MFKNYGIAIALVAGLALTGCTSTQKATFDAIEKGVVEPKVDGIYDDTVKRLCSLPLDIQVRALQRKAISTSALTFMCPEWRAIRDLMLGDILEEAAPGALESLRNAQ